MYRVWGMFQGKAHQEERAADLQNNMSVPDDIAECCSVSEIKTCCYHTPTSTCGSNPIGSVNTDIHSFFTSSIFNIISYGLVDCNVVSTRLHGITSQNAINVILTNPQLPSAFILQHTSQRQSSVSCYILSQL
jgi:hypothetical protein